MTREVVVVAGVRTAVGDFGGSLKDFSPTQLGAMVVKEVVARAGVSADQVGHHHGNQQKMGHPGVRGLGA